MSTMSFNSFSITVVVVTTSPVSSVSFNTCVYLPFSTLVCSVTFILLTTPFPICPSVLSPNAQIVPSCFSASVWLFPAATFSSVFFVSPITFMITLVSSSVCFAFTVIYVLPNDFAVTSPVFSSTSAISGFNDVYVNPS